MEHQLSLRGRGIGPGFRQRPQPDPGVPDLLERCAGVGDRAKGAVALPHENQVERPPGRLSEELPPCRAPAKIRVKVEFAPAIPICRTKKIIPTIVARPALMERSRALGAPHGVTARRKCGCRRLPDKSSEWKRTFESTAQSKPRVETRACMGHFWGDRLYLGLGPAILVTYKQLKVV